MRSKYAMGPMAELASLKPVECGKDAAKHFAFDEGLRNLNHGESFSIDGLKTINISIVLLYIYLPYSGSFGAAPISVHKVQHEYQQQTNGRPDAAIRYENPDHLDKSRAALAKYLHAPVETCVFVPNASTGVNTVLRNLVFKPNDVIVYFATIYSSCEKSISYIQETTPAVAYKIQYTYPVSDDHLCDAFETATRKLKANGKNPRVAIFDTIVSLPGVRMPFERLTKLCRQHGVLSLIDGAHGVGHIPLKLSELDPDFFVSNCHKWLYTPRACAIFYVPLRNQVLMRSTLPTSHGFVPMPKYGVGINNPLPPTGKSEFVTNFEFVGTLDDSPYLCVPAALEWRSKLTWHGKHGEDAIMSYCAQLARRSGDIVSRILGTEILENNEGTLRQCNFSNVRLPLSSRALTSDDPAKIAKIGQWIAKILVQDYQTFIAIIYYGGAWWMRLSSQVYLTEEDFEWAGKVLLEMCKRVENGEWNDNGVKSKL
jgi:selenocysteine lyase/cysteine desulfurase